jgi:hypothetical protein
MIGLRIKK